jgi:transcriptional regulator with XRE-family HTH domain
LSINLPKSGHTPSALRVLGQILAQARALVGRSPEQVGAATGLSGKTIRRLEAGLIIRPHTTTLEALANFYALDADVLHQLVLWRDLDEDNLLEALRPLDDTAPDTLDTAQLAMRSARRGFEATRGHVERALSDPEIDELVENFLALDQRRRTYVRLLVRDLRVASEQTRAAAG